MPSLTWDDKKFIVHNNAGGCCEYCQTCEVNIGQRMHIDHIIPNGGDDMSNLCLSCWNCNTSKGSKIQDIDLLTDAIVSLYNPRKHLWTNHFMWEKQYTQIDGITKIGRATVRCLKMNRAMIIIARRRWVEGGFHPPNLT